MITKIYANLNYANLSISTFSLTFCLCVCVCVCLGIQTGDLQQKEQ